MSEIKISEERFLELIEAEKKLFEVVNHAGGIFISMASAKTKNGTTEQIKEEYDKLDKEFGLNKLYTFLR